VRSSIVSQYSQLSFFPLSPGPVSLATRFSLDPVILVSIYLINKGRSVSASSAYDIHRANNLTHVPPAILRNSSDGVLPHLDP
jgi:hypothetical protein